MYALSFGPPCAHELLERRFDEVELLIIYIDGMHFGDQFVLAAVDVGIQGCRHVLALREEAAENAEAGKDLLQHLVEHGVDPSRRRLFIIDGSKALRTAINAVFETHTPLQRVGTQSSATCWGAFRASSRRKLDRERALPGR